MRFGAPAFDLNAISHKPHTVSSTLVRDCVIKSKNKEQGMKHIKLNVSEQDWENLKQIAQDHETKANRILEKIIFDLTCSIESGGSDERDFAALWLSRSRYNL
ncbi:MAG: hypothetical protein ACLRTQ_08200 [Candidatus Borkfalkia sp.]